MAKAEKPGKYDAVLADLPKVQDEHQDKVNEEKAAIIARGEAKEARMLAEKYIRARAIKSSMENDLYDVNIRVKAYEQLIDDSQLRQAAGWGDYGVKSTSLRLSTGGTVRVERAPHAVVKDRESFRLWCVKNGYERKMALPWSTTNEIVKERLVAGEPEPDGCETWQRTKIVYTKGDE